MPYPTFADLRDAYNGDYQDPLVYLPSSDAIRRIAHLVAAAWAEDEAERERGRRALDIVRKYAAHRYGCMGECICGLDAAMASLDAPASGDPLALRSGEEDSVSSDAANSVGATLLERAPKYEPSTRYSPFAYADHGVSMCEDCDYEEFNREQRLRREGWLACSGVNADSSETLQSKARSKAAKRFPLKRRTLHEDVTLEGITIRVAIDGAEPKISFQRDGLGFSPYVSRGILSAALEIAERPWSWRDDISPEGGAC